MRPRTARQPAEPVSAIGAARVWGVRGIARETTGDAARIGAPRGQVVLLCSAPTVGYDSVASAVFVMVVCFWRTDTTCYGSLYFNSGGARKPILVACGETVVGSANHPRGTQSISGFPKDDSHGTGGGFSFFSAYCFFSSRSLHSTQTPQLTRVLMAGWSACIAHEIARVLQACALLTAARANWLADITHSILGHSANMKVTPR